MVGSTLLKQSSRYPPRRPPDRASAEAHSAVWFDTLAQFFRDIKQAYSQSWQYYRDELAEKYNWGECSAPELWKINGDELIYSKILHETWEAYVCLEQWIVAVKKYRIQLREKNPELDLKCTAWLAGFPLGNTEIIFPFGIEPDEAELNTSSQKLAYFDLLDSWYQGKVESKNYVRDYIGPSIDTGFRLATLASPRKMIISVDLALMMASIMPPDKGSRHKFEFRYEGRESLKGVLKGKPYPVFWIDMLHDDNLAVCEDTIQGESQVVASKVRDFCLEFYKEHESQLIKPFIDGCQDTNFNKAPDNYKEHLIYLLKTWKSEKIKSELETKALSGQDPPDQPNEKVEETTPKEVDKFEELFAEILRDLLEDK